MCCNTKCVFKLIFLAIGKMIQLILLPIIGLPIYPQLLQIRSAAICCHQHQHRNNLIGFIVIGGKVKGRHAVKIKFSSSEVSI